jgi:hypothetical protein
MFNTYMQLFLDVSVADNLLHGDTNGTLGDVEYDTCLAMVILIRQTFLLL